MTHVIASVSWCAGASRRRLAALTSLWLLAGQFGAAQFASLTRLEVNMGYLDFGDTTAVLYSYGRSMPSYPAMTSFCSTGSSYRSCIQQILASYHNQGITGVRFQFDMHQALILNSNGVAQLNTNWFQGLNAFFGDLKTNSINNVTPTIGWRAADWPSGGGKLTYSLQTNVPPRTGQNCPGFPTYANMRFSPTAPFGEFCTNTQACGPSCTASSTCNPSTDCCSSSTPWSGVWDVPQQWSNDSYDCAPANTYTFVGWSTMYGAVNALLQAANSNGLTVTELDGENEMTLDQYSVHARLIVDNTHSDELVLTNLRQAMSANGFDPGKVTYSVYHLEATVALYNCGSVYGDSARILEVSELLSAIDGLWFGTTSVPYSSGLKCGGSTSARAYLPMGQPSPTIIDMHDSPCVGNCDPTVNPWSTVTGEATTDFNALDTFRESFYPLSSCPARAPGCGWRTQCCGYDPNLANALIVIGETFAYTAPNDTPVCPMTGANGNPESPPYSWSRAAAVNMVTGFNGSWLQGVTLPNGNPGYVVFRPWEYLQEMQHGTWTDSQIAACNPIVVNSNSVYTPTN